MKNDLKYINGLKGFACLWVMMGHYIALYTYSNDITPIKTDVLELLQNGLLAVFFNRAPYWLYLFFVISGYLAYNSIIGKRISTINYLVKAIRRLLRFLLPMWGACLVIFIFWIILGGWHYEELSALSDNPWIAQYYDWDVTIVDVLCDPIRTMMFGDSKFNPMWWCIRNIYCISIGIYIVDFVGGRFSHVIQDEFIDFCLVILAIGTLYSINQFSVMAGMCGALVRIIEGYIHDLSVVIRLTSNKVFSLILVGIVLLMGAYINNAVVWMIGFGVVLLAFPYNKCIRTVFDGKGMGFLGSVSFGIYSFHLPVLYVVGGYVFGKLYCNVPNWMMFLIGYIVCISFTLFLSVIFKEIIEVPIGKVMYYQKKK